MAGGGQDGEDCLAVTADSLHTSLGRQSNVSEVVGQVRGTQFGFLKHLIAGIFQIHTKVEKDPTTYPASFIILVVNRCF